MKQKLICFVSFILIFGLLTSTTSIKTEAASKPITVILDGAKINFDVKPVMKNNRVMVPYRALLEAMGAKVYWHKSSGTIRSTREGESIQLTLFSKTAYVNGKKVSLDVPATIIDGRTLVPLRFISENLNGKVYWNSSQQSVTILIDGQVASDGDIQIFLNDKKISLNSEPIVVDSRTYIPFESFVNQMDEKPIWIRNGNEILIEMVGASITSYIGKSGAMINGETIPTSDYPIEKNGSVYATPRYITDVLGGSYYTSNNEVYLNIKHSEPKNGFLKIEQTTIVTPKNVPSASLSGERRMLVSDNPENLTHDNVPYDSITLWDDFVNSDKGSIEHRVHGWHMNSLGKKVRIGITIENKSKTNDIEVSGLEGIVRKSSPSWQIYDVGLPIAEAVLRDNLSPIRMNNSVVKAGSTDLVQTMELNHKQLIGFLSDFSVKKASGTGDMDYVVRVVLSQSDIDLTKIKLTHIEMNRIKSHPRGIWAASQLQTELPTYQVGSEEVAFSISNGKTDDLMTAETSLGNNRGAVRNPGHYGATYKVKIPLENYTGTTKTVRVRLSARGGTYNGAIKVLNQVYLVPNLKPATEVANVIDYKVEKTHDVLELEIMHSGGASLPLAIDVLTID